ncbi:MAG: RNA polymerase sigma factor [Patescibacteria group bacterium]
MNRIEEDFLSAYDKYAPHILRHAYFRVSDKKLAEDIAQEAFLKTWKYIAKGAEVKNLKTFIYQVANNLIIDFYRKKDRTPLDLENVDPKKIIDLRGNEKVENLIDKEILEGVMEELDEDERQLIISRYINELSIKEISEITGKTPNHIRVNIHRGVKKLKSKIYDKKD